MTGLIRVLRAGSEAVSESQAACEGRCVRLAQTGGCPRLEEPLGAKPAMVRSRRAEGGAGIGFRDWCDPCPGAVGRAGSRGLESGGEPEAGSGRGGAWSGLGLRSLHPGSYGCYGETHLNGVWQVPSPVWVDKVEAPPDTLSITGMNEQRYLVSRDGPRWKTHGVLGR